MGDVDYTYDPLQRLTAADYSTGDFYHYDYDAVGNRLSQASTVNPNNPGAGSLPSTVEYAYDDANRLLSIVDLQSTIVNRKLVS